MKHASEIEVPGSNSELLREALLASERAKNYLFSIQKVDGHWCSELESNTTMTAEYVFLYQMLGLDLEKHREKLIQYFFANQKDDGSWGIAYNYPGDISTTAETYLALRILGLEVDDNRMKHAKQYIRSHGGIEKIRIFTRIYFALFGLFPWDAVPITPPEFIFLPPQSPINIYRLSNWARGFMVPLFVIFHHKPIFTLPNGKSNNNNWLDHLWLNPSQKKIPYSLPLLETIKKNKVSWKSFFSIADRFLHLYEHFKSKKLRENALQKCEEWILKHQEKKGDWFGFFPVMLNSVLALYLNGKSLTSSSIYRGLSAIERFGIEDKEGFRIQASVSPVWDTINSITALIDAGAERKETLKAHQWIAKRQLLVDNGDWKIYNPKGAAGGWSFQYENSWSPDIDDTAAIIIGILRQYQNSGDKAVRKAAEWVVSMQNKDGGWAAFDKNNDNVFLNNHPFSDMGAFCDPSSPDVTGRALEALGLLNRKAYQKVCSRAIRYLRGTQESEGSWFGRWGVNYIYGTSSVLRGLSSQKILKDNSMVRKALAWIKRVQNSDGGWGERLESYTNKSLMGKGNSTASQTAWALLGLLAYLPMTDPSIKKGIHWLVKHQKIKENIGFWDEKEFTGTGLPKCFYHRYSLYPNCFPLMALGRFCSAYS